MKAVLTLVLIACFAPLSAAEESYLTPLDFGFGMLDHGRVDFSHPPPQTTAGYFNTDNYLDIARFDGNQLEIYISSMKGFTLEPQQLKTFTKPISSLGFGGTIWDTHPPLKVIFTDGTEEMFFLRRGMLDLGAESHRTSASGPPRTISEAEFQIVWEGEEYPYGLNECVAGDLDNDGIIELVTFWKESTFSDTAWIQIYKNYGDNNYDLFMEEAFTADELQAAVRPSVTFFLITDLDQNGQSELIFTYDAAYIWEFSAPGEYNRWTSNFIFPRAVSDVECADVDDDGILELVSLCNNGSENPPTAYNVWEFLYKSSSDSLIFFDPMWGVYESRNDHRLAVGDFDNDDVCDIISGNFDFYPFYIPYDIPYYRYDGAGGFDEFELVTGIPATCRIPLIEDLDDDGFNELFVGGSIPGHGSTLIWESTGFQSGLVSLLDTINTPGEPNYCCFNYVDGHPTILSTTSSGLSNRYTICSLWNYENNSYNYVWQSDSLFGISYYHPSFFDLDGDLKVDFLIADSWYQNRLLVWEQTAAGIQESGDKGVPDSFRLHPIYPNPFNHSATISFDVAKISDIVLTIYDISGRIVYTYSEYRVLPGVYEHTWHAADLGSGIYFIELRSDELRQVRKGVLLK